MSKDWMIRGKAVSNAYITLAGTAGSNINVTRHDML
jgi:hypothetical protein